MTLLEELESLRPKITEHLSGKSNIQTEEIFLFQKQGEIRMLDRVLEIVKKYLPIAIDRK